MADNTPSSQPSALPPRSQPSDANYLPELPLVEDLQALLDGRYAVEAFLGQGGMGAVFRGLQMPLRRPVAIKILQKQQAAAEDDFAFEERFKREAYAMAALTHPNIVQVYDCGDAGEHFLFISMELVEGGDLSDAMKAGNVNPEVALKLIPQICDGLQAAHERGIVHRDIKPANIFLTKDGRAKVADFGLAKKFDAQSTLVTKAGLGMGTPDYAAPEQYEGVADIDHRADIYALGVMMYQMLTGRLPRGANPKSPSQLSGVDSRIDAVVRKAMETEREDRYQSTAQIKAELAQIAVNAQDSPIPVTLTGVVPSITRPLTGARPVTEARPVTGARPATVGRPVTSTRASQPVRRPASGVVAAVPVAEPETKKKPNVALIGVIAAVVVLGLGALFLMRKPAPTTSDTSTRSATAASTPSPASTSTPKTSPTLTPPLPAQWTSAFTNFDDFHGGRSGKAEAKDGWVTPAGTFGMSIIPPNQPGPVKNAGMRARIRYQKSAIPADVRFQFEMRIGTGHYYLGVTATGQMKIGLSEKGVASQDLPSLLSDRPPLNPGEEYVLEFFVIGTRLVARCDGQLLGTLTDARLISGEGKVRSSVPFRDVEVINLDGMTEAEALKIAGVDEQAQEVERSAAAPETMQPGQWTRVPWSQVKSSEGQIQGDKFILPAETYVYPGLPKVMNALVRIKVKRAGDLPRGLQIKQRTSGGSIHAWVAVPSTGSPQGMIQVCPDGKRDSTRSQWGQCDSLARDKESTFEFGAIGDLFFMIVDGRMVASMKDDRLMKPGGMALFSGRGQVEFRDFEVLPLDGLTEDKYPDFVKDALAMARAVAPSTPSAPASTPVAATPLSGFPPGQWVKPIRKLEDLPPVHSNGGLMKWEEGWLKPTDISKGISFTIPGFKGSNMVIRGVMRNPGANPSGGPVFQTRITSSDGRYEMTPLEGSFAISHLKDPTRTSLAKGVRRAVVTPDRDIRIELAVLGSQLYGRVDDVLTVRATDSRLTNGGIGIHSKSWIRDIEVLHLDGVAEAEALRLIGVDEKGNDLRLPENEKFVPGQWTKVYTQADQLPPDVRLPTSGVTWDGGWIHYEKSARLYLPSSLMGNYGVRARFERVSTKNTAMVTLRNQSLSKVEQYKLSNSGGSKFACEATDGTGPVPIFVSTPRPPVKANTEYTMEFGVVGNRLVGRLNDSLVKMASDDRYPTGHAYFTGAESTRDIEVINLDGLPEAEALRLLGVDEAGNDLRPQELQRLAQARLREAIAAIPEVKPLHDQFHALQAERVTTPFEADLAKLNADYLGGIDRALSEAKAAGRADDVAALEAEKTLIASRQPVPPQDDEKTPDTMKKLRGIYRGSRAQLDAQREASLKTLTEPLGTRLAALATDFTSKGRDADAKVVQEFMAQLSAGEAVPASAPAPSAANGTVTAAPAGNAATPASEAPARNFAPADSLKAAEWVLSLGGTVDIEDRGARRTIRAHDELPKGRFDIVKVWLDKTKPVAPPTANFTTLEPLAGLKKLVVLDMHYHDVQDSDTDVLASLPALVVLNISDAKNFTGQHLGLLRGLSKLDILYLAASGITRAGLEAISTLKQLPKLDLSNTPLTDDDVAPLAGMKGLNSLYLRSSKFTVAALRNLKNQDGMLDFGWRFRHGSAVEEAKVIAGLFPRLIKLGLEMSLEPSGSELADAFSSFPGLSKVTVSGGSKITDDVGRALAGVPTLAEITIAGSDAAITDSTFEALAQHKNLKTLRFDTGITSTGLKALARIRSLSTLDVGSNAQIDEAAMADFKKQRPDVNVVK